MYLGRYLSYRANAIVRVRNRITIVLYIRNAIVLYCAIYRPSFDRHGYSPLTNVSPNEGPSLKKNNSTSTIRPTFAVPIDVSTASSALLRANRHVDSMQIARTRLRERARLATRRARRLDCRSLRLITRLLRPALILSLIKSNSAVRKAACALASPRCSQF